jgi:hypothetical protein
LVLAIHAAVDPRQLTAGTKLLAPLLAAAGSSSGNTGTAGFGFGFVGAVVVVGAGVAVLEERTTITVGAGVEPPPPHAARASAVTQGAAASDRRRIGTEVRSVRRADDKRAVRNR